MTSVKERKRTKGEIACAECRRLKARCDKRVPCSTCIKRGCDMLCPNSTMPPGDGSRFVGAAEEFLRRKIAKMEERMRSLEDALVIIAGPSAKDLEPLLSERWPAEEDEWAAEDDQDPIIVNEFNKYGLADTLGALHLDEVVLSSTAHGTYEHSESLLIQAKAFMTESSSPANLSEEINGSCLPSQINVFYNAFPSTPSGIPTEPVQEMIESYLPPLPRATALCETFFHSLSWMFSVVSRQHVLGELIPTIYRYSSGQTAEPRAYGSHDLALLLVVCAIGALVDPSLPPYNAEGQHYHRLSRASLCLQPIFDQRSIVTIKTLNLMSIYNGMCGIESKLESSYHLLDLAAQVALQIGFHKDPSVWGITGREAYERRTYFWDLLNGTLWQCLVAGRPPVIAPPVVECQIPTDEEEAMYQRGEVPRGFGPWSFKFIAECLIPVVEATQSARPPSYDAILALDRKIREFSVPLEHGPSNSSQMSLQMQAFTRSQLRELTLLFLHRAFFAQALADFPWDPLRSPHCQSFLTTYQSATAVLSAIRRQFADLPVLCSRVWRLWSFVFTAATIIGTVAIKQLSVKLEPEPFQQLDHACTLFHEAARTSVRAQKALPILLRLRQKAVEVRLETQASDPDPGKPSLVGDSHNLAASDSRGMVSAQSGSFNHGSIPNFPVQDVPTTSSGKFIHAHPPPVVHLPLAKLEEGHAHHHSSLGAPLGWGSLYGEMSAPTTHGFHGVSSSPPFQTGPVQHGQEDIAMEDRWTPFMHDPSSSHLHSRPP